MNKVLKIFILCLLFFPATTWGQSHLVPGTAVEEPLKKHHHDRPVNFGIKGGFTSSLFLVSNLTLNGITIDEVQNNYKIGYFGSVFMRINFERHFLQPEISYNINRCNITFEKPAAEDAPLEMASITSEIHSARFGMGYIGHLLLRNVKLLGKDFPVALGLVEQVHLHLDCYDIEYIYFCTLIADLKNPFAHAS